MYEEEPGTPASDDTSDAVLLLRTREGDSEAYGHLYLRHVGAARVLARQLARDPHEADELVAESFARVLSVLQRGGGPEASLRPYLLSAMRRLNVDRRVAEQKQTPTEDMSSHDVAEPFVDVPAEELERTIVSQAYASLPERWRLVLWHTEVEGLSPAQVAPVLGISANATAALAVRARAGLRDAYLTAHVSAATEPGCRTVGASLGGYVRGTLSRRERATIDTHLEGCTRCSAAVLELSDTAATMRAVIGPLILGAAVFGYREGVLALGAHAIPSASLFAHGAAGAAAAHVAGATAGAGAASGGGSAAGTTASSVPWQVLVGAGVAGVAVLGAAIALAASGGHPHHPVASPPKSISTPGATPAVTAPPVLPTSSPTSTKVSAPPTGSATAPTTAIPTTSPTTPPPAPPAAASARMAAVGDLVAGRNGILQLVSTNPGGSAATQSVTVHLPAGFTGPSTDEGPLLQPTAQPVVHALVATTPSVRAADVTRTQDVARSAATAPTPGTCTGSATTVTCDLGTLAAHASSTLDIPVGVPATGSGGTWSAVVTSTAHGLSTTRQLTGRLATSPTGLSALWTGQGRYQVSAAGAALLTCQDAAHPSTVCSTVVATRAGGPLTNDRWTMYPQNQAGAGWTSSARATLRLPADAKVVKAYLSWSASGVDAVTADRTARFAGPGEAPHTVSEGSWQAIRISRLDGYVATADVTDLITGSGTYTVGDIALPTARTATYGGWTLTVVTTSAATPEASVTLLEGPDALGAAAPSWTGTTVGLSGQAARVIYEAWEGDDGLTGDTLQVRGHALSPLDGATGSNDVAASYADGSTQALSFGVDVRQLAAPAGTGGSITATSTNDSIVLGLLAVTAD